MSPDYFKGLAKGYQRAIALAEELCQDVGPARFRGRLIDRLWALKDEAEDNHLDTRYAPPKGVVGTD